MTTSNHLITSVNVGIDVGKAQLDIHLHEPDLYCSVQNSSEGIARALKWLDQYPIKRIVIEATGRYEQLFVEAALDQQLPVIVINPKRRSAEIGRAHV